MLQEVCQRQDSCKNKTGCKDMNFIGINIVQPCTDKSKNGGYL